MLIPLTINYSFGHGVGSETFPPVDLEGKRVTLEVSSSSDTDENNNQEISISMIDFDSKVTLRDVTFLIKSERGEQFLFEKEFQSDNGILVFNFISENTEVIKLQEEKDDNLFGSLLGFENKKIHVKGPKLSEGGLYTFDVSILTVDSYSNKLEKPIIFNAGISIAQTKNHQINDENFGSQTIQTITFYDELSDFNYNSNSKEITFSMPFEWTASNINQTSVVHEEIVIPKTFGDLLVSGFSMYVNGIKLSDDIVTIDDFFSEERVVHFIINQKELWNIFEKHENQNGMNFIIKPSSKETQLSSVTDNGQFRVLMSWEPEALRSNSHAKIIFDITDIFLKNRPVAVNYDFTVTQNEKIIYDQNGFSTDSRDEHNIAEFFIPSDTSGIININFENLADNNLAKTSFPVIVDRISNNSSKILIPEWIRNNAAWWAEGQIDDNTFVQGIQYLIKNDIFVIPPTEQSNSDNKEIPEWIHNNAAWWAEGQIDDNTFVQGIQFLIEQGILRV